MNNEQIKALLEKNRAAIEKQDQLHVEMEKKIPDAGEEGSLLFGPQTELEFQRVLRDIKEADNDKK